jgi:hypothetical protein
VAPRRTSSLQPDITEIQEGERKPGEKMVYYFTSNVVEPAGFIYVGKDKFESKFAHVPALLLSGWGLL